MVEEKSINPKILEPFRYISHEQMTFEEMTGVVMRIAQKLFIDIGIQERRMNNIFKQKISTYF